VVLNGLTKHFGGQRGVSNVCLDVEPGQVFGFLGPNGAGKSTTIRLMLGLYRPTSGNCRVLGLDPVRDGVELLGRIGYLPGELSLFPRLTGREILDRFAHVRRLDDRRLRSELVDRFHVELDRPVRLLSKGNRQKIGLVLAFMHRPELLVLDEPTSGLDPLLQDEFASLLGETVADGRTVFLSSHDLDEVQRVVEQLAIIKDGQVVVSDTVEGLRHTVPRTIELEFAEAVDPAPFAAQPGVDVRSHSGCRVVLTVTGPLGPVLAQVATMQPIDIVSRPADLDELFLRFYADDSSSSSPSGSSRAR
jgi:ABC-2 type transport system ATP-binding protein